MWCVPKTGELEALIHCSLNEQTPWLKNRDLTSFVSLSLSRTFPSDELPEYHLIFLWNSNAPFFSSSLSLSMFSKSHFYVTNYIYYNKLFLYFAFVMPLPYFPITKSFLSFFLCLFSFRPSLSPPAFSLTLSPQSAAECTTLFFPCHSVHSSGANLFFTSPPMWSVCTFGKAG